jgi:uncharacterized membrane protein
MKIHLNKILILCSLASMGLIQAAFVSAEQPTGFVLAYAMLIIMVIAMLYVLFRVGTAGFQDSPSITIPDWQSWVIPLLALAGLGVAGYLAYVETQMVSAICGPVGDCNAVQNSSYALMFGVLPVGVLGAAGYVGILVVWAWGRFRQDGLARLAPLGLFAMTFLGTLFSTYLTYLEPFVIKAVCMWCISSAVIMTLLLLLSMKPMLKYLSENVDDVDEEEDDLTEML